MAARTRKVEVEIIVDDPTELFEQAEVAILKRIVDEAFDGFSDGLRDVTQAYRNLVGQ